MSVRQILVKMADHAKTKSTTSSVHVYRATVERNVKLVRKFDFYLGFQNSGGGGGNGA